MPDTPAPVRYRVSMVQSILIKSTATTLDVLGFILMLTVIGEVGTEVIGLTGGILFFVWFWFLGVNYTGGKASSKMVTIIANSVAESIPFLNGIYPGFTIETWRLISIMKKEDEEEARKKAVKMEKINTQRTREYSRALQIRSQRMAANDNAAAHAAQGEAA